MDAHNNNGAEYATLEVGLHICIKHGVKRLSIKGYFIGGEASFGSMEE